MRLATLGGGGFIERIFCEEKSFLGWKFPREVSLGGYFSRISIRNYFLSVLISQSRLDFTSGDDLRELSEWNFLWGWNMGGFSVGWFSRGETLHGEIFSWGKYTRDMFRGRKFNEGGGVFLGKKLTKEDFRYDSKNDQKFNKKRFFFFFFF